MGAPPGIHGPGSTRALADEVPRQRALDLLARRWDVPLATVVAPAGFGKTVLLRQVHAANLRDGRGVEVVVTCRRSDADADRLARRILEALQAPPSPAADDPEALGRAVATALGARSPLLACLLLDDVHELGEGSGAVALVAELLRELPATGHLVLAGRSLPDGLPLARLRAGDELVEVGEDELAFDADEVARLVAARPDVGAVDLDELGGWPALVRLSLTAGRSASMEFLRQEVLDRMSAEVARALGVAIVARGADDGLLRGAGATLSVEQLAASVPLVHVEGARAVPHALWRDVVEQVLPGPDRADVAVAVARVLQQRGDDEDALEVLVDAALWDRAAEVVLDGLRTDGPLISRAKAARWAARFPPEEQERPAVLLLRGVLQRLAASERRDPRGVTETFLTEGDAAADAVPDEEPHEILLRRAAAGFVAEGRPEDAAAALVHLLWTAIDLGDVELTAVLRDDVGRLERDWPGCTGVYGRVVEALAAWLDGDAIAAASALDAVVAGVLPPSTRAFVELQRAAVHLAAGNDVQALAAAEAARTAGLVATGVEPVSQYPVVAWMCGDPEPVLAIFEGPRVVAAPSAQDRFRFVVYAHTFGASLGLSPPLDIPAARAQSSGSPRDLLTIALTAAAVEASLGDDGSAADRLAAAVDPTSARGVDGELLRHLCYLYVLHPSSRAWLDGAELGPLHLRMRALARVVVALREGGVPRWDDLPAPPAAMTWLPLPWSVALAVAAQAAGRPEGRALAVYLLDTVGEPARERLRALADADDGEPAAELLASVPTPPDEPVRVACLGPLTVRHGDAAPTVPRRRRVRELLALLVLRGEVTRDVAMATLWPDLDRDRARNNLNVTVRHLRTELEPSRRGGEAPFVLRTEGGRIRLVASRHLHVDLWESRRQLSAARVHEEAGDLVAALEAHRAAVAAWRGEPLEDLAYVDVVAGEREGLRAGLLEAACRGAELAVARGEVGVARELAELALAHDPLGERALRALVAAAVVDGDADGARAAVARAEAAATELGVQLDPETRMLARQAGA